MHCIQNVSSDIIWVGGSDRRLALFENMFPIDNGVTYNSFLIKDEKVALIDTVDTSITRQFFENLDEALDGQDIDYLVINHMEPDHCANIEEIIKRWPDVKIVGNKKTFQFVEQFYHIDISMRTITVKDNSELSLGKHNLKFIMAPMVHWPEVMFTHETKEDILFSADAFGTFGGYTGNLFCDETDYENLYLDETRRYYTNIVGKFGPQVLATIKKLGEKKPRTICPLHGPILRGEILDLILDKYNKWASYQPEKQGVVLAYASMYGNTENAVNRLAGLLSQRGVCDMRIFDVSKTHYSYLIAQAFKYSNIVLASPTYNKHLYSGMDTLVRDMEALNLQNRNISIIGNGTWAISSHTLTLEEVEKIKNTKIIGEPLVIKSNLTQEQESDLETLADQIAASIFDKTTD